MNDKESDRPMEGTPEFEEWLSKKSAKHIKQIFSRPPVEVDECELVSGNTGLLDKTDADLFPDEIEEYTPEERRKTFKSHTNNEKGNGKK